MSHRGGARDGETLIFDLKAADGHLVFGPYLWYPAGSYEATFDIAVTRFAQDPTNRLVIDVVTDAGEMPGGNVTFPPPRRQLRARCSSWSTGANCFWHFAFLQRDLPAANSALAGEIAPARAAISFCHKA